MSVIQSHGGSGKQALEVANGLEADVVTLALEGDVQVVADAGLIEDGFADEFEQDFWDKNPAGKRFSPSYLYPGNLKEVLPCGNLERSGMDILADKGKKFYVNRYIMCFHARRYWEYLVKSGLYELVTELCDRYWWGELSIHSAKARNLKELLRVDGNRVNRMKQIDGGVNELEWLQYELKYPRKAWSGYQRKK